MAPAVSALFTKRVCKKNLKCRPMISAMESESTDGEGSLLSLSGTEAGPSAASVAGFPAATTVGSQGSTSKSGGSFSPRANDIPPETSALSEELLLPTDAELETPFFFETDHLALKGNPDYHILLRTVAVLQAQRQKAILDMDKLIESQKQALQDPIAFVHNLQQRKDMGLPGPQTVPELPHIEWEKYTSNIDPLQFKPPKHMTRHSFRKQTDDAIAKSLGPSTSGSTAGQRAAPPNNFNTNPAMTTSFDSSINTCAPSDSTGHSVAMATTNGTLDTSSLETSHNAVLVRGRVKDTTKSSTFNKLWTVDEQRRLEELLVKYPPEEVEMRRWAKIAKDLGNRTTIQVASRVQKYFIKLTKAGIPVPGRIPSTQTYNRKSHKHHRHNRLLFPLSTFLSSYEPPVFMTEEYEEDTGSYTGSSVDNSDWYTHSQEEVSDEEEVPAELRDTEEYRQLLHLKKLRKQKQHETTSKVQHLGFKCDRCESEPIVGVRWHCVTCPVDTSVDFCDNCADFVFETKDHKSNHQLDAVREAEGTSASEPDRDYTRFMPGDYNYLDPNYMPAT